MVEAICKGDLEAGFQALIEHIKNKKNRSSPGSNRDEK
jgi:hypothetical protein